jgi:hypothetical protein
MTFSSEDAQRLQFEVIADGDRRSRLVFTESESGDAPPGSRIVWDGKAILEYYPDRDPRYNRIDNPDEQQIVGSMFVFEPGRSRFAQRCGDAKRLRTQTLIGTVAVRYACARTESGGQVSWEAHEMSLDQATGLLLRDSGDDFTMVVTEVSRNPNIDEDTFSTTLPEGAEDTAHPKLDDFRLPRVGGGEVALADYPGRPLVIVAGDAEGIRRTVQRLLPLTGGGTKPQALGMLTATPPEEWKGSLLNLDDAKSFAASVSKTAGTFNVPVAHRPQGGAGYQITEVAGIEAGQTRPTAVGFTRSDGTLAHVTTDTATDAELRNQIDDLA